MALWTKRMSLLLLVLVASACKIVPPEYFDPFEAATEVPVLNQILPAEGVAQGSSVAIRGRYFGNKAGEVRVNGVTVPVEDWSGRLVIFAMPLTVPGLLALPDTAVVTPSTAVTSTASVELTQPVNVSIGLFVAGRASNELTMAVLPGQAACGSDCAFVCSLDGADASACAASFAVTGLTDGTHSLSVRALAGAISDSVGVAVTWTVDATPPVVDLGTFSGMLTRNTLSLPAQCSEQQCMATCSIDGQASFDCSDTILLTGLADGTHEIVITVVDKAGNKSEGKVSFWIVTTVPPALSLTPDFGPAVTEWVASGVSLAAPPYSMGRYGSAVAFLKNYGGSGKNDIVVGAPQDGYGIGMMQIYSPAASASVGSLTGTTMNDQLGTAVEVLADVDGDGKKDIFVSAPGAMTTGVVYVYSETDLTVPLATLRPAQGAITFGTDIVLLHDLTGDGIREWMFGAAISDVTSWRPGYQIFNGDTRAYMFSITGGGSGVGLNDVNGDQIPDIAVGKYRVGQVNTPTVFSGVDGSKLWSSQLLQSATLGDAIATVGDANGDGAWDFVIADPAVNSGTAYLISGADGSTLQTSRGGAVGTLYANMVPIPDHNGDGIIDLLIGNDNCNWNSRGCITIYSGKDLWAIDRIWDSRGTATNFGWAITTGDVNGDGAVDIIVGDPASNGGDGSVQWFLRQLQTSPYLSQPVYGFSVGQLDPSLAVESRLNATAWTALTVPTKVNVAVSASGSQNLQVRATKYGINGPVTSYNWLADNLTPIAAVSNFTNSLVKGTLVDSGGSGIWGYRVATYAGQWYDGSRFVLDWPVWKYVPSVSPFQYTIPSIGCGQIVTVIQAVDGALNYSSPVSVSTPGGGC